jgi:hypothetical protein
LAGEVRSIGIGLILSYIWFVQQLQIRSLLTQLVYLGIGFIIERASKALLLSRVLPRAS